MRNNKGFSLVELIVVIAIMAVLAAVAVIGVSIYIPKAQAQADAELLNVLTDALVAACLSEGVDQREITATIAVDQQTGKLAMNGTDIAIQISGTSKADEIADLFNDIVTDKNAKFNIIKNKSVKFVDGKFDWSDGNSAPSFVYGGGTIVLDQKDIDALKGSTYYEMGMGPLMGQLDEVTDIITTLGHVDALNDILATEDFYLCMAESLGIDTNAPDWPQKLAEKNNELALKLVEKEDISLEEAHQKIRANATVLYTAQLTAKMTDDEIADLLETPTTGSIIGNMTGEKPTDGLAQAALLCGLYTSYVNRPGYVGDKTVNVDTVLKAIEEDPAFLAYIQDTQGQKDLAGYRGSMNMINGGIKDADSVSNLLVNGFDDQELVNGLDQSLGNKS